MSNFLEIDFAIKTNDKKSRFDLSEPINIQDQHKDGTNSKNTQKKKHEGYKSDKHFRS